MDSLILALAKLVSLALNVYLWLIIIRALISWVNPDPYNRIVLFLNRATEPVLAPLRQLIPLRGLPIDLSPILAIFAIVIIESYLLPALVDILVTFP